MTIRVFGNDCSPMWVEKANKVVENTGAGWQLIEHATYSLASVAGKQLSWLHQNDDFQRLFLRHSSRIFSAAEFFDHTGNFKLRRVF